MPINNISRALSAHYINHLTNVITLLTNLLFAAGAEGSSTNRNYLKLIKPYNHKLSLKNFDRYGQTIKWISILNTNISAYNKVHRRIVEPITDATPTGSYPWSSTTN